MPGSNDYSTAEGSGVVSNLESPQQPSFGSGSGSGSGTGKGVLDALSGLLPLLGPAGSVASMIYNFGSALWSNSESKKAAELQHERNIADWRMKNEYDSPAAQMARFRAAGLNPNLIYGQQSVSGATGSNASHPGSSVSSPDMSGYNLSVQAALDRKMKEAQIENLKAQSDDLRASARERSAKTDTETYNLQQSKMWDDFERQANVDLISSQGLSYAIGNWLRGASPDDYWDSNSNNDFNQVYLRMKPEIDAFRNDLKNQYSLTNYDVRYMDELFTTMVNLDREKFDHELNYMRSNVAVLKFMSDNEWAQFVNYLFDKLSGFALQASSTYRNFRGNGRNI